MIRLQARKIRPNVLSSDRMNQMKSREMLDPRVIKVENTRSQVAQSELSKKSEAAESAKKVAQTSNQTSIE